ncbi:ABC transporter permease [Thermococcus camini]|uniref:Dipeptide/oligopeptide ABC transporter permease 6 n=1 Tax=Thermococcus camini TaxID=2016373 RepID=A0A7G2D9S6_9EURY|nr:ABC transporter permease subunit [Thermococcus camini]CAD5245208.1 Dipeptide/oligopeptide ABC transporter permease 6 [Thermococcus camini]
MRLDRNEKAGITLILLVMLLAVVPVRFLVPPEKAANWNYLPYWNDYPKNARPIWLPSGFRTLESTGTNFSMTFTVDGIVPGNVMIEGNSTVRLVIHRPDGLSVVLGPVEVDGRTSINSNPTLAAGAYEFAESLGYGLESRPLFTPTQFLFMGYGGEVLEGRYTLEFESSSPVAVTVFGDSYGLLGTDSYGRDLWVGFVLAGRSTLLVSLEVSLLVMTIGLLLGLFAGYYRSRPAILLEGLLNSLGALPVLPLAMLMIFSFSTTGIAMTREIKTEILSLILALLLAGKFGSAVRGFVVQEKVREHVAAARALGAGDLYILRRHILKPVIPYALSHFSLLFPKVVALVAILGFFNMIPSDNWGSFILEGLNQNALYAGRWWWFLAPLVTMVLLSVGFALLWEDETSEGVLA